MEQVFFRIHVRALTAYTKLLSPKNRVAFEYGSFIAGALTVVLIAALHAYFLSPTVNPYRECLLQQVAAHSGRNINNVSCYISEANFSSESCTWSESLLNDFDVVRFLITSSAATDNAVNSTSGYEYFFSTDRSLLQLAMSSTSSSRVAITTIPLTPSGGCFGPPLFSLLLHRLIGYDTILTALLSPTDCSSSSNYLTTRYWGRIVDLPAPSSRPPALLAAPYFSNISSALTFKSMALLTSFFLFFTTSTLVSYTLRETQSRMLHFTHLLQLHTQRDQPIAALVITHIIESLVFVPILLGMLFFMFEFFAGDRLLAFYVLSLVWMCEVFSVVSLRTVASMRLFSRSYLCYFTLFHLYLLHFPVVGFSHLALLAALLLLGHIMVLCWNRYELPALRSGLVSALQPRGVWVSILESEPEEQATDSSSGGVNTTPHPAPDAPTPLEEILALEQQQQRQQQILAAEQLLQQESTSSNRDEVLASHVLLSRQIQQAQMGAHHSSSYRLNRHMQNTSSNASPAFQASGNITSVSSAASGLRSTSCDSDTPVLTRTVSTSSNNSCSAAGLTKNRSVNDLGYGRNDFTVFGFGIDDEDMQYYR